MPNRQNIYIGLSVSIGICTGIGLYILYRHRRKIEQQEANSLTPKLFISSINNFSDNSYSEANSPSEIDNDESELIEVPNGKYIPDGSAPLTLDQATLLTHYLNEPGDNNDRLYYVLTSIANASTFKESQVNLTTMGCIVSLRGLLLNTDSEPTICKIFLALHNLALNDFAITQFSGIVPIVIHLCLKSPSNSLIRLNGLPLLINMCVLEYLHEEYMNNINDLALLIKSTMKCDDEALSAGKILVNLSTNKLNLRNLLKITGVELKSVMNVYTSKIDQSPKSDHILLRFLSFYCNIAEMILSELNQNGDTNNNNYLWLLNSALERQGTLQSELLNNDKQILAKSLLRPQYTSSQVNSQMKRLYQLMEKIRQRQHELSTMSSKIIHQS